MRWLQCSGRQMTVTKFARDISMKGRLFVCVLWPSRIKRTGLTSDGFACFKKCSNHITKMWDCIHPVSCAIAIDAGVRGHGKFLP